MAADVLVIDDDPDILTQVRLVLVAEGYEVLTTRDPRDALRLVEEHRPPLVLLDINLGDLDGFAVLGQLLGTAPAGDASAEASDPAEELPRVLMLTSRSSMEDVRRAIEQGASDYLFKPVEARYLVSRVAEYLSR